MGDMNEKLFPPNMNPKQFTELFFDLLDAFSTEHVVEAEGRPIGIIAAKQQGLAFEPHAVWFQWATKRQILQGAAKYLNKRREEWGLIHVPSEYRGFMMHLTKYGVVRPVGQFLYHPEGQYYVFETVRRD